MASPQPRAFSNIDVVMNESGDSMGWGGDEAGGNVGFQNPYLLGDGGRGMGMGMVIPNRMYNMVPVPAMASSEGVSGSAEPPPPTPPPVLSHAEMMEEVQEDERLRKSLDKWHAEHLESLMDLRDQMQRSDALHAAAMATVNGLVLTLQEDNLALRNSAAMFDEKLEACNKALLDAKGKHKQYKHEYTKLKNRQPPPNAGHDNGSVGMAAPRMA